MADTSLTPNTGNLALERDKPIATGLCASLAITGLAVTLLIGPVMIPGTGALVAQGQTPSRDENHVITPPTGGLVLTGAAPGDVGSSRNIQPAAGALTAAGAAPTVNQTVDNASFTPNTGHLTLSIGTALRPPAGALVLAGAAPQVGVSVERTPATGALTATGQIPVVVQGSSGVITPGTGALWFGEEVTKQPSTATLGLAGVQPSVIVQVLRTPSAASLLATGIAGRVEGRSITGTTGQIVLEGQAPTVTTTGLVQPSAAALAITGEQPTRIIDALITPTTGALTAAGAAPRYDLAIQPDAGALATTGTEPALAFAISPPAGELVLESDPPEIEGQKQIRPRVGAIVATGVAPTVDAANAATLTPGTGALVATGTTSTLRRDVIRDPAAGALVAAGATPFVGGLGQLRPGTGELVAAGQAPGVRPSLSPPAAAATLAGQAPTVRVAIIMEPAVATLAAASDAPGVVQDSRYTVEAGSLVTGGLTPTLRAPVRITPNTGELLLPGRTPFVGGLPPGTKGHTFRGSGRRRVFVVPDRSEAT